MSRKYWLYLGVGTDAFHIVFIISVLVCGRLWMPESLVNLIITLTVMGQIVFLWCPLSVISNYCYRRHNPEMKFIPSISLYLYNRFGRVVGIPIFAVLVILSALVGMARF